MNTAQRILLVAALIALGAGLHAWFYEYESRTDWVVVQNYAARQEAGEWKKGEGLQWTHWNLIYIGKKDLDQRIAETAGKIPTREWLARSTWDALEEGKLHLFKSHSDTVRVGADTDNVTMQWSYLRVSPDSNLSADETFLAGALGPVAALLTALFLVLGWRKPKPPGRTDAPAS